jgi:DNA-binding PucR family transcriptional regulator
VAAKPADRQRRARQRADGDNAVTLGRVVENLDPDLIWPLVLPLGSDVVVSGPVLHDAADPIPVEPASIVLAVGLVPTRADAVALVRTAGAQGAAAVAFKLEPGGDLPPDVAAEAHAASIAVVGVHPDMAWGQLYVLLRTAVSPTGQPLATGTTSVPAGDLFGLAHAIAAMVGGPVTIEDTRFNVLAYSRLDGPTDQLRLEAILHRRTDELWLTRLAEAGVLQALWSSPDAVQVDPLREWGLRPRIAIAVRAGTEILGSIWVAEGARPLRPDAGRALREAAQIAALHMLRHRASEDLDREHRGQLLQTVLDGRGNAPLLAERLGIDTRSRYVVVALGMRPGEEVDIAIQSERVLGLVSRYWDAYRRQAVCTSMARAVYTLLPVDPHLSSERIVAVTHDVIRNVESAISVSLRAGIGSEVELADVARSRREADQVLQVLGDSDHGKQVADIASVRSEVFLMDLERLVSSRPELMLGKLSALADHDRRHDTAYVDTLRAYLTSFGDITSAADTVAVHSKTFRYRMRRVVELSGIDLDDPAERLVAQLQLRCGVR